MKKTLQKKLWERKIKKPGLIYKILGLVMKKPFYKQYNVKINMECDIKHEKEPFVLISNHASRMDYIFTCFPILPKKLNYVVGYNEFFRSHLKFILKVAGAIPKMNFTVDMYAIRQMFEINKKGGNIAIMLEGMSSISGHNQPVALGSSKLLKKLNSPVYYAIIQGAYLSSPKFNLKDRKGEVTVTFKKLFSKEDLEKYTCEEMQDKLNEVLFHDDYLYNLEKQIPYESDCLANGLEYLLYKCPKCHQEFTNITTSNTIECTHCHNKVHVDNCYNLKPEDGSLSYKTPSEWFDKEREDIRSMLIENPDYTMEEEVDIGVLPKYKYLKNQETSIIVGHGILKISKEGLEFKGIKEGQDYTFLIPIKQLPTYGMCTDCSRFYTFVNKEFIEFYPKSKSTIKWFHVTEELYRLNGGEWKDFGFQMKY